MRKPPKNVRKNSRKTTATRGKKTTLKQHVFSSLTALSAHKHTGKRLHHRHTSHGALLLILLVAGILLFLNINMLQAYGTSISHQVTVGATVTGTPPTVGAIITNPTTNTTVTSATLTVRGTCPASSLVAIYNNGGFVGSTICTSSNLFQLIIQLRPGTNVLQAQNYDRLNQPGPASPQITVFYKVAGGPVPDNSPVPQPDKYPCFEYSIATGAQLGHFGVIVACIVHSVYVGEEFQLPITIVGGKSPYALSIDWGDDTIDLKSLASAGQQTLTHTYKSPGLKQVTLRLTDTSGATFFIQTVVEVNGAATSGGVIENIGSNLQKLWIEAPVPLYWLAVVLTMGFWLGDLFDRKFGQPKQKRRHA